MVQCNYCEYTTTADEYGLLNAPSHLLKYHGIPLDTDTAIESHFHFVKIDIFGDEND